MTRPVCPYCGNTAKLVGGDVIYPHREDLWSKNFWQCKPCNAYVGCHPKNERFGQDGTRPLGRLADANLRQLKSKAHAVFDPLWKEGSFTNRGHAYLWLAEELGLPKKKCHIGFFGPERCQQVIDICTDYKEAIS